VVVLEGHVSNGGVGGWGGNNPPEDLSSVQIGIAITGTGSQVDSVSQRAAHADPHSHGDCRGGGHSPRPIRRSSPQPTPSRFVLAGLLPLQQFPLRDFLFFLYGVFRCAIHRGKIKNRACPQLFYCKKNLQVQLQMGTPARPTVEITNLYFSYCITFFVYYATSA
jgi:hypothetical protein